MHRFLAVLACSLAALAAVAAAEPLAKPYRDVICKTGELYYPGIDPAELGDVVTPVEAIRGALKAAGYAAKVGYAQKTGCYTVEYQPAKDSRQAYRFQHLSAQTSDKREGDKVVSCQAMARAWIDSYVKASKQKAVLAGIARTEDAAGRDHGSCRFDVYAVLPPSEALPATVALPDAPR